mmetsp:Transcript_51688/g.75614  ORF Transcript_51688/g.75614 Transcript_51688/m.75614 type:complete len:100 (-) Transcript_51688:167-466(-)
MSGHTDSDMDTERDTDSNLHTNLEFCTNNPRNFSALFSSHAHSHMCTQTVTFIHTCTRTHKLSHRHTNPDVAGCSKDPPCAVEAHRSTMYDLSVDIVTM